MGTTLTGTTPANTYDSLIKVTDNGPLSGTGKYLSDGLGNDSKLALSTSNIGINTTSPSYQFDVNGDIRSQGNIRSNNGVVDTVLSYTSEPAGVVGTITNHPTTIWANGAERMRINSTGNVGIGTSNPSGRLSVVPSVTPITPTTASQITVGESSENSAYNLRIGYFANGGYKGSLQSIAGGIPSDLILNGDGGNVGIGTISPANKLHISGGSLKIHNIGSQLVLGSGIAGNYEITTSTGNKLDFTLSGVATYLSILPTGGITFNGDTAAANALDDYEEGTWTPSFIFGTGSATYTIQSGTYTRIGRSVTIQMYISVNTVSSVGGTLEIQGMPYGAASGTIGSVSIWGQGMDASAKQWVGVVTGASTTMRLYNYNAGSLTNPAATLLNGSTMNLTATYFV